MSSNNYDRIKIVMVNTSHPGNIGAAARAMKTMGLGSLYLVNPQSFPDKEADIRAVSARGLLDKAQVCSNLDEALNGTILAAALTARSRELEHETYDARMGAQVLLEHASHHPVALVFGAETSGLTSLEVSKCQLKITIPTSLDYTSLNLASAVQVMAYELRMAMRNIDPTKPAKSAKSSRYESATLNEIELLYQHLEQVMIQVDFLNPLQPKKLMQRIRRLFSRAQLEKEEVNILRGILSAVEKQVSRNELRPTKNKEK